MEPTTTIEVPRGNGQPAPPRVPPLRHGDRLTREEFHRRYAAMSEVNKAELIEGVVYMPSPVRHQAHSVPNASLVGWLWNYGAYTPGIEVGTNGTLRLDLANEPQPDAYAIVSPECGGKVRLSADDYVIGGPELVGEASASSVSFDLHDKLNAYRRNGVQEYVVWRVEDRAVDWFILRGEHFEPLPLSDDGYYKCAALPGLWLDPQALLAGDGPKLIEVIQQGLQTTDHAAFVTKLATANPRLSRRGAPVHPSRPAP